MNVKGKYEGKDYRPVICKEKLDKQFDRLNTNLTQLYAEKKFSPQRTGRLPVTVCHHIQWLFIANHLTVKSVTFL